MKKGFYYIETTSKGGGGKTQKSVSEAARLLDSESKRHVTLKTFQYSKLN